MRGRRTQSPCVDGFLALGLNGSIRLLDEVLVRLLRVLVVLASMMMVWIMISRDAGGELGEHGGVSLLGQLENQVDMVCLVHLLVGELDLILSD